MNCEMCREALIDYLDGALGPAARADLRRHLEACADCSGTFEAVERQQAVLTSLPRPEAPETLWPKIQGALADRRLLRRVERPGRRAAGWLAAAAALLIAAAGTFALVGRRPDRGLPIQVVDISMQPGAGALGRMVPGYENPDSASSLLNTLVGANK